MHVLTVSADWRIDPDTAFALSYNLNALRHDRGSLVDYLGLPKGDLSKG